MNNKLVVQYNENDNSLEFYGINGNTSEVFITKVIIDDLLSQSLEEGCRLLGENVLLFLDGTRHIMTSAETPDQK